LREPIKRPTPWVAQPEMPDLPANVGLPDERVGWRNEVRLRRTHSPPATEPQHFPPQLLRVLGPILGIVRAPSIAQAEIEKSVGSKIEIAAVVIRVGVRNAEQHFLGSG